MARKGAADAANGASEYICETLADAAERRVTANEAVERAHNGAASAAKRRALAAKRCAGIEDEIEQRPLLTLAIAAGIGFLAGMAGRRH